MKRNSSSLKVRTAVFKGGFIYNPVLTQIIGICPIVIAATTIKNALFISAFLFILLLINESLTSLLLKSTPRWVRLCFYTVISAFVLTFSEPLFTRLYPDLSAEIGIYFYLLAVNSLIVIRCEKFACKTSVRNSLIDAFASGFGYSTVAVIVGALREYINYGAVLHSGEAERFPFVNSPFAALLILGFLAAIHRFIVLHFYPKELSDTFFMNEVWEKLQLKDPGLFSERNKEHSENGSAHNIKPRHLSSEEEQEESI